MQVQSYWQEAIDVTRDLVRRKGGVLGDEMLKSESFALESLRHKNPVIRFCALNCCDIIWKCGDRGGFYDYCISAIASDSDELVRASALRVVGMRTCNGRQRDIQRILAQLVKDEQWSSRLRSSVYVTLWLSEFGNYDGLEEHLVSDAEAFRDGRLPSLETIYWRFVERFATN